jgi:glucokinase
MNSNEVVIGIDIGGTTTAFGLVDRLGNLRAEGGIPTQGQQPAETLVARLHEKIGALRKSLAADVLLRGIGIGAPNANSRCGTVENPPNLNWGASVNLVQLFQRHYDLPVAITNDANAAALGELHFGGARGMRDFIVITLGTGLGSGIVANGELISGVDGCAGELGHTVVDAEGRVCACGKKGCLETYVSAGGLCRTAFTLLAERNEDSSLRTFSYQQLTSRTVSEAAEKGDVIALAAFDATARILGIKLADAVAHTGPEAIFLFGGLAAAGNLLLVPTQRYMEEFLFRPYSGKVKLLRSTLPEGSAAVLGAAALIWHGIQK